jgi:hypothetical protein
VPDWLVTSGGWISLALGVLSLGRGATLLRRGSKARDSTGTPVALVLAQGGGLALVGAGVLLRDNGAYVIAPALVLSTVGTVTAVRSRRRRQSDRLGGFS